MQCLWNLAQSYSTQKAQKALDTFETQITSFTQGIEAWQQWVTLALQAQTQDAALRSWVLIAQVERFQARINDDPEALSQRLRVTARLDPEMEKLRFST